MRFHPKLISGALTLLAFVSAASGVRAEDDNAYDGKSYPGTMCVPQLSATSAIRTASAYINSAGAGVSVLCPIVQDSWVSTTGLSYGVMTISQAAGNTFSCTQTAFSNNGAFVSSRSFSTTVAGTSNQYFFSGTTYLPTTGYQGYIVIQCTVPAGGTIWGYQVQERA